ncbi:MAG: hypothetical protein ACK2U3_12485, partial [Anaerolineales bacterium]
MNTESELNFGPLRNYLFKKDSKLALSANRTWEISNPIHDRQTEKGGNINSRMHVEVVEKNIWRLLRESNQGPPNYQPYLKRFTPYDLYLLSLAACCHDFDKSFLIEVLGGEFKHGEGSGRFFFDNWQILDIENQTAAIHLDWIISIHDYEDFDKALKSIPKSATLPPLRLLAIILKAADTLHMDESRISKIAVPDDILVDFDHMKQLARGSIQQWGIDGRRIEIAISERDEEAKKALQEFVSYVKQVEWPPIARKLRDNHFPFKLEFKWIPVRSLKKELLSKGITRIDSSKEHLKDYPLIPEISTSKVTTTLVPEGPFKIIAIRPKDLGEYLCEMGSLSVINNDYIEPEIRDLGSNPGAISRVFLGPANCGKTRVAYEWIMDKVGVNEKSWVILHPEPGKFPLNAFKFEIDWKSQFGERRRKPTRAILFVDDFPDFLPLQGKGPEAAESVKNILNWLNRLPNFQECCFVGTIRTKKMIDKPEWPESLLRLGEDLHLLHIETFNEFKRRQLWKGMERGYADFPDGIQALGMHLSDNFINIVARQSADPETIAYFVWEMAKRGKKKLVIEDADLFSDSLIDIWLKETWPVIHKAYGPSASIFYSLARFLEAESQTSYLVKESLSPLWEYHSTFGPELLEVEHGNPDEYIPMVERMISDCHALGVRGEWIRPKFNFLFQTSSIEEILVGLPTVDWFAKYANKLSPLSQVALSMQFSLTNNIYLGKDITANWLFGHAIALGKLAGINNDESSQKIRMEEILTYKDLVHRFGDDEEPGVRDVVARGLFNEGVALSLLDREEDGIA